jgi:hypothetical protein
VFEKDWGVESHGKYKWIGFLNEEGKLMDTFEWKNNKWDHLAWLNDPVVRAIRSDLSLDEVLAERLNENIKKVGYGFTPPDVNTFTVVGTLVLND